jgi:hypothetical protein
MRTAATPPVMPRPAARVWPWLVLAGLVVVFRTALFVWQGTVAFDADQALVGLMAKHIAEFRAFPVFQYALPYILIVSAWLTAPFMWVLGPTIAALKLPLLMMNVVVGVWLVRTIALAGVPPAAAFVLSLPLLAVAPITAAGLMDALGMTIEPFVFVAALWATRRSPVLFGLVGGVGFLVREFVAYGMAAAWLLDLVDGRARTKAGLQHWALVLLVFVGTKASADALNRFGSAAGPGTWFPEQLGDNLAVLSGAFCFAPQQALANVVGLGQWYLGLLFGAAPARISSAAVHSLVHQGASWLWPVLGLTLLSMAIRLAWAWRSVWAARTAPAMQFAVFLVLVGTQSVVVYAISQCMPITVLKLRYALLGIFLPTGLALAWWLVEPSRRLRHGALAVFVVLGAVNLSAHARLWHEQMTAPPVPSRAALTATLQARGVRFARSDYWTAYYVSFLSRERVVVGSTGFARVDLYERQILQHPEPVPVILTSPCEGGDVLVPGFWLCPAP